MDEKLSLKEFLVQFHKDTKVLHNRDSNSKEMVDAALAKGYEPRDRKRMSAVVNNLRHTNGMSKKYPNMQKAARKRVLREKAEGPRIGRPVGSKNGHKPRARRKYNTAGEARAAKVAANAVRRQMRKAMAEGGVVTHPGSSASPAAYSEHDRDFLSALKRVGVTRARELIDLLSFLELVT